VFYFSFIAVSFLVSGLLQSVTAGCTFEYLQQTFNCRTPLLLETAYPPVKHYQHFNVNFIIPISNT